MFIAKPFIGFSITDSGIEAMESHSLLAKSFSKRKPEDLEDAKTKAADLQQKLSNPAQAKSLTVAALLCLFFPIAFKRNYFSSQHFIKGLKANLIPAEHSYLLTRKLII